MGPASQGTPTPMMSPAPPGGPQDSMGYNMNMNGGDYNSSMSGSQVRLCHNFTFVLQSVNFSRINLLRCNLYTIHEVHGCYGSNY
jgi:hypothetical protein